MTDDRTSDWPRVQLHIVSGKGGTGKTTVAAALALALASKGKSTCKVSGARALGIAADTKTEYVETACADGLPGYVIAFDDSSDAVKDLITCGAASGLGGGCKLPTNMKK